jgi:hypothetical protein
VPAATLQCAPLLSRRYPACSGTNERPLIRSTSRSAGQDGCIPGGSQIRLQPRSKRTPGTRKTSCQNFTPPQHFKSPGDHSRARLISPFNARPFQGGLPQDYISS